MTLDAPERPATTKVRHPLVARTLTVRAVTDLSRSMRRVELDGPDLAGFVALGPTDHAKLFFPAAEGAEVTLPVVHEGHWLNRDDPRLVYRDYTVRTFTGDALTVDLVVHEHGPAGRWAARATPGQTLGVLGPRGSALRPLDRPWYLLAVDETGLPAVANWLDRLPASTPIRVLAEVAGPEDEVALSRSDVEVTWLHRRGAAPGTTSLLPDAVGVALAGGATAPGVVGATPLPDDAGFVFAAGEVEAVRAIRAHVRERGLVGAAVTSYWRRGVANFDHHSPEA